MPSDCCGIIFRVFRMQHYALSFIHIMPPPQMFSSQWLHFTSFSTYNETYSFSISLDESVHYKNVPLCRQCRPRLVVTFISI